MGNCPVCNSYANIDNSNIHDIKVICTQCGKFSITDVAIAIIPKDRYPNWAGILQEYIQMNQTDGFVEITEGKIKTLFGF